MKPRKQRRRLSFGGGNSKVRRGVVFVLDNAKLKGILIFSLPAGFTCPGALQCLARADRESGKLTDGPATEFRCYAATGEALFKNVRISRWRNFELLRNAGSAGAMAALLNDKIARARSQIIRIHQSGDFFSQSYFDAWIAVARSNPGKLFYCYTKALPFWIARLGQIPANMRITASRGGKFDHLIEQFGLVSVRVVYSVARAAELGLEIDHDDTLAMRADRDFAVLIHNTQPPGSEASAGWQVVKKTVGGYSSDYPFFNKRRSKKHQ